MNSGSSGYIAEFAIAIVPKEAIWPEISDQEIGITIIIVITYCCRHPVSIISQSRPLRGICKCSITVVFVEFVMQFAF